MAANIEKSFIWRLTVKSNQNHVYLFDLILTFFFSYSPLDVHAMDDM